MTGPGNKQDGAKGLGDPAPAPDYLAKLGFRHLQLHMNGIAAAIEGDLNQLGLIHEMTEQEPNQLLKLGLNIVGNWLIIGYGFRDLIDKRVVGDLIDKPGRIAHLD